jgi:hypothetical protein
MFGGRIRSERHQDGTGCDTFDSTAFSEWPKAKKMGPSPKGRCPQGALAEPLNVSG